MKTYFSSNKLFILGFAIIIITNIFVLYGVASNRSEEPTSLIKLTERELILPYYRHKENSGIALILQWRTLGKFEENNYYSNWGSPEWFDRKKLKELGFKVDKMAEKKNDYKFTKKAIPKEVFIVLEYNGKLYNESLERAKYIFEKEKGSKESKKYPYKNAKENLEKERFKSSRLFAIDAGLDPKLLRSVYSDKGRFMIVKGLVKPRYNYNKTKNEWYGFISKLSLKSLHVPLEHRKIFENLLSNNKISRKNIDPPRYEVKVAYGKRFEPWIMSVHALNNK